MFKNRGVFTNTLFALFISQCIFWLVFLNYRWIPTAIPLWFLQPWGEPQLASREWIWLLPGLSIGILSTDLIITALLYRRQPFLVNIIMSISSLSSLYLLFVIVHILNRIFGWL
ncbi:hypothetical protein HGA91_01230 [candidate division WWE3 bacterium]|nr:hypothetical protein [candidate division WWE3 bacterium]